MANAPVSTASFPEEGSQSFVGLALAMELAINELADRFPAFFGTKTRLQNYREV